MGDLKKEVRPEQMAAKTTIKILRFPNVELKCVKLRVKFLRSATATSVTNEDLPASPFSIISLKLVKKDQILYELHTY
jgi:hypothetical protein